METQKSKIFKASQKNAKFLSTAVTHGLDAVALLATTAITLGAVAISFHHRHHP